MNEPIRVGIRGLGLLGSRLAAALQHTKDLRFTVGIVKNDPTLDRLIDRCKFGGFDARKALPEKLYLDERDEVVKQLNAKYRGFTSFLPLRELRLGGLCDVMIDAASPERNHFLQAQYQEFPGPIIQQDGEYPRGRLIAPPLITPPQGGNRFRQGGCFLSGIVPVLAAFQDILEQVRVHLVMQHDGRESDFLITERINTFRFVDGYLPRMEDELSQLFPNVEAVVESVIQIPGMLHYAVPLVVGCRGCLSVPEVRERLGTIPRVRLLPDSVVSAYDVNLARVIDDRIPPILVFGGSLRVEQNGSSTKIRMLLALYYRTLAVLPNIDAVRILVRDTDPLEAMCQTDRDMGFVP